MIPFRIISTRFSLLQRLIKLPTSPNPNLLLNLDLDSELFSELISVFLFGKIFKTTKSDRYPLTAQRVVALNSKKTDLIVADIGCSDGLASLSIVLGLNKRRYYFADLNTYVLYLNVGNRIYFYDDSGTMILACNKYIVVYPTLLNSTLKRRLFKTFFNIPNQVSAELKRINFISPIYMLSKNVSFIKYNIFDDWCHENIDLVILGNILNRSYFSDQDIVLAIKNILKYLNDQSFIVVIDNRENQVESSSIFSFIDKKLKLVERVGDGSDIEELLSQNLNFD